MCCTDPNEGFESFDAAQFYGEGSVTPPEALNFLRILTGQICWRCWEDRDEISTATTEHCSTDYCADCYEWLAEKAWEQSCEDYYGGSGPQTLDEQMAVARGFK